MKSISQLISKNIQNKAGQLKALNQIIKATVPENCRDHISVAGIRENRLILITDSPVWASRLRLYTQNMLAMLEEHAGIKVHNIQIRQMQPRVEPDEPVKKSRHLDKETANMIKQSADSISDTGLQQALYHLAQNQSDKKNN
ncbi:MAG: DUF721 domain-containing protein [Gammaproteobacteria bacterium]|nr:DUF721 domain-containing protein [Gammaproteobacteria bacterium]